MGSAVVDRLLRDGHSIRVFERPQVLPYRDFEGGQFVEWVTGDLLDERCLHRALDGAEIVLHLMSTTIPKNSNDDPIFDIQTNLIGTLRVLDGMVSRCVSRIVFVSSGGTVYGEPAYLPIDEQHATNPLVSYGITKLASEKYLQMYGRLYGIEPIILRVANAYGERQRVETAQGAVGVFLARALAGLPIEIWGDGEVTRDFVHVSDVAEAFAKAVTYSGSEQIFNISSGVGTSLNRLVELIEQVLGSPVERLVREGRAFDVPVNVLSNASAMRELRWSPTVCLKDGIARTANWLMHEALLATGGS